MSLNIIKIDAYIQMLRHADFLSLFFQRRDTKKNVKSCCEIYVIQPLSVLNIYLYMYCDAVSFKHMLHAVIFVDILDAEIFIHILDNVIFMHILNDEIFM